MTLKSDLRTRFRTLRKTFSHKQREIAGRDITEQILNWKPIQTSKTVALFASYGDEIPTATLIERLKTSGRQVLLPRVERSGKEMVFCSFSHLLSLEPDRFGIPAPDGEVWNEKLDIILTPGLVFGINGGRVGYGGGFYDRYIAKLSPLPPEIICGLGFDEQVLAEVPLERHDLTLTHIATPSQIVRCRPVSG